MVDDVASAVRTSTPTTPVTEPHLTEREVLKTSIQHDYATAESGGIVPLDQRRKLFSMAALWLTMNCGFGEVFIGFQYQQAGFTLLRSLVVSLIGIGLYFAYAMPAAYIGSRTGTTHSLLARAVFGKWGAFLVASCLLVMGTGFVGFQSYTTAQIFQGLFGWDRIMLVGIIVTIVCIVNNVVGFSGVVAWARYVVTPVVVLWIAYMMIKAFTTEPMAVLGAHPPAVTTLTTLQGIMAILGVCVWGDEPDFWRYGKPSFWWAGIGYAVGLIVGDLLFTLSGWVMAQLAITRGGDGSFANAVTFTTTYSLFGLVWLAFIVSVVSQMAAQDGNYYAAINALQGIFGGIKGWSRLYSCVIAVAVACLATWFVIHGGDTWEAVVNFGAAAVPSATVIMVLDHYIVPKMFGMSRSLAYVPKLHEAGSANIAAIVALLPAIVIGTVGAGTITWFGDYYWFLPGPLSWVSAGIVYLVGMAIISRTSNAMRWAGYSVQAAANPIARSSTVEDLATLAESGRSLPLGSIA
ncbi:MAG: cytosine permease [Mycobacterium sp.]|nr:cytosine permease [Mycobacterium sp.]